jgi:hypothetical protein
MLENIVPVLWVLAYSAAATRHRIARGSVSRLLLRSSLRSSNPALSAAATGCPHPSRYARRPPPYRRYAPMGEVPGGFALPSGRTSVRQSQSQDQRQSPQVDLTQRVHKYKRFVIAVLRRSELIL